MLLVNGGDDEDAEGLAAVGERAEECAAGDVPEGVGGPGARPLDEPERLPPVGGEEPAAVGEREDAGVAEESEGRPEALAVAVEDEQAIGVGDGELAVGAQGQGHVATRLAAAGRALEQEAVGLVGAERAVAGAERPLGLERLGVAGVEEVDLARRP